MAKTFRLLPKLTRPPNGLRIPSIANRSTVLVCRACGSETKSHTIPVNYKLTPFEELGLSDSPVSGVRVRQHVNPLCKKYQVPIGALNWSEVFADPNKPLVVDAGCGGGRFLLLMAKKRGLEHNYLGIEIREKLVNRANEWAAHLDLADSVHFVFGNITISLDSLLEGYPGRVALIAVQFPDPQFKRRNQKRHIVQKQFVEAAAEVLPKGGELFFQSDVESVSAYMRNTTEMFGSQLFEPSPLHKLDLQNASDRDRLPLHAENDVTDDGVKCGKWSELAWLKDNPLGVPTERELLSQDQNLGVYRMLLVRK